MRSRPPSAVGGQGFGVPGLEWLPARLAHHLGHELVPAVVLEDEWRPVITCQIPVAPGHQGGDDGVQVAARAGQVVFEAGRVPPGSTPSPPTAAA
jgi:hypothetical protein